MLCLFSFIDAAETCEWRILGQERDGGLLFSWLHTIPSKTAEPYTCLGLYYRHKKELEVKFVHPLSATKRNLLSSIVQENILCPIQILYQFERQMNIIQASINSTNTAIGK